MSVYKIFFSPTGRSKKVIDAISKHWDKEIKEIDLCLNPEQSEKLKGLTFKKEDICFVIMPSYAGYVPVTAAKRFKNLKSCGSKTIIIASYGNRHYDDTLLQMQDLAKEQGFHVIAAVTAVTEHSVARNIAKNRPDNNDLKTLQEYSQKIKNKIKTVSDDFELSLPGKRPFKEITKFPFEPKVEKEKCNKCGLCIKSCPVAAIDKENPLKTDYEKCISCLKCIEICPENARYLDKELVANVSAKLQKANPKQRKYEIFI